MRSYFEANERFCLICNESLDSIQSVDLLSFCLCKKCRNQFRVCKKIYKINQVEWHVLYEYDDFLERLFFRYKEQCDRMLAPVFLEPIHSYLHKMKKYTVCSLCSSDKKRMQRGFDPLSDIFTFYDVPIASPLYKKKEHKQSKLSKEEREKVNDVIFRKEQYTLADKPILLVDDVCTTGSSLQRGIELLSPNKVFVIAAHPLWLSKHQEMIVEKKSLFW